MWWNYLYIVGGQFSSRRNFFSLSNSLYEIFFYAIAWIFFRINWRAWIFFTSFSLAWTFFFCTLPPPLPPPHNFSYGPFLKGMDTSFRRNDFWDLWFEDKRYLWLLEYRRLFVTTACAQKRPQKSLVPFLKRGIGSAKNELLWSEIGESFQKACRTDTTSIFQESSSWAANGP